MRILFDSKQLRYKDPFGTLTPGQTCKLNIYIPMSVPVTRVFCNIQWENGDYYRSYPLYLQKQQGAYGIYSGEVTLYNPGLYFYYFHICKTDGEFRLFKQGDDTNMEAGDMWQLSCTPDEFTTPDWAKGAIIYQIFPDRFYKSGTVDLTGKLEPYTVHRNWNEEVSWQPTEDGMVLNNDFYGGNFNGITEKMDYLEDLGVGILYLNPISKSFSSHRYDTGDYKTPDPMLGTEADFVKMCNAAHVRGMKVILDGVYSHTGSNSLYFNKEGTFPGAGAYQDWNSQYHDWYTFYDFPNNYHSWWNFDTLPTINKLNPGFMNYIIDDEDSVVAHWMKLGADGFRLDVADELPDEFIYRLKQRIRSINPEALLMGEVWEDASNKISYHVRRRYFVDSELDSVMNYPFRTALINFMRKMDDGHTLRNVVMQLVENYPPQVMACTMNLLGTHDTPRILTALMDDFNGDRAEKAARHLSRSQWVTALERLNVATFLQFALPGAPSIYYGDEAGMEGYGDPFCRRPYPWGREDIDLREHFRRIGRFRKKSEVLRMGDIQFFQYSNHQLGFTRSYQGKTLHIYVNRSSDNWEVPSGNLALGHNLLSVAEDGICLGHMGYCILEV